MIVLAWWLASIFGNFWNAGLSVGFSICDLQRHRALRARQAHEEEQQAEQVDVVCLVISRAFDASSRTQPNVCFTSCMLFAISIVAIAAPPMVHISNGTASMSGSMLPPDAR